MPHTIPGTGNTAVSKTGKSCSSLAHFLVAGKRNNINKVMSERGKWRYAERLESDLMERSPG